MADNNLIAKAEGEVITEADPNQYRTAMSGNLVPRNVNGVPTDLAGTLGESDKRWDNIYSRKVSISEATIDKGVFAVGDVKMFHDFNGLLTPGKGWMKLNGDVVNETNYNAIHGAGAWDTDIGDGNSPIEGKNLPDMNSKYAVGSDSTTQDGSSAITPVGITNHLINLNHSHTVNSHNHQWHETNSSSDAKTYNSGGSLIDIDTGFQNSGYALDMTTSSSSRTALPDAYTSNSSPGTNSQLSSTQSIQPESHQLQYWIRII